MAGTGIVGLPWRPQACGGGPSRDRLLISSRAGYCLVPCSCFSQSVNHHCDSDHGSQKKPCPVDIKGTPPFAPVTDRVAAPNCPSTTMIALIVKVPLMLGTSGTKRPGANRTETRGATLSMRLIKFKENQREKNQNQNHPHILVRTRASAPRLAPGSQDPSKSSLFCIHLIP